LQTIENSPVKKYARQHWKHVNQPVMIVMGTVEIGWDNSGGEKWEATAVRQNVVLDTIRYDIRKFQVRSKTDRTRLSLRHHANKCSVEQNKVSDPLFTVFYRVNIKSIFLLLL